jgi:hypothetical protein
MKKNLFWKIITCTLVAWLFLFLWMWQWHYYPQTDGGNGIRTSRLTHKTYTLFDTGWKAVPFDKKDR